MLVPRPQVVGNPFRMLSNTEIYLRDEKTKQVSLRFYSMTLKRIFLIFAFWGLSTAAQADLPWTKEDVCMGPEEMKLYGLINDYRRSVGLKAVPLSMNLSWVAQAHAIDLLENRPFQDICNMHSWSDQGPWEACCYTDDHANAGCMWHKPGEFTAYPGSGYEIVFYYFPVVGQVPLAEYALSAWKESPGHNNTIINRGVFGRVTWNAMGVGIMGGFVVVWFGEERDPDGAPPFCIRN